MTLFMGFGAPHGMDFFWLFIIFVLLFGAQKLPELARGLGKSLGEFKKAKQDFEHELNSSLKEEPKITPPPQGTIAKSSTVSSDPTQNN